MLIPKRLYLYAALIVAVAALGWWLRHDAVQDHRLEQATQEATSRIRVIEDNKELIDEIENLDDCGLVRRWDKWLRKTDIADGQAPVLRCGNPKEPATSDGSLPDRP